MLNIGKKIAELRKQKNWSQGDLAKAIEASRDIIGKYERGENSPSVEMALKLADALDISVDYLLGKTEVKLDKTIMNRIVEIQNLPAEDKKHILYTIDGLLQNVRTKLAFAK